MIPSTKTVPVLRDRFGASWIGPHDRESGDQARPVLRGIEAVAQAFELAVNTGVKLAINLAKVMTWNGTRAARARTCSAAELLQHSQAAHALVAPI